MKRRKDLDSSELSPGNHILYRNRVIKVDPSEILGLEIGTPESTFYKPLVLNTEVLEKFGFQIIGGRFLHEETGFALIPRYKENGIDIDGYFAVGYPGVIFRSAHNLENFFRIVTSQPLKYSKP